MAIPHVRDMLIPPKDRQDVFLWFHFVGTCFKKEQRPVREVFWKPVFGNLCR